MSSFDQDVKWQGIRNKLYGVAALVLSGLVLFGVVDESQREGVQAGFDTLVRSGESIAGIVVAVVAWAKSRTSRVSVVKVPAKHFLDGQG